MATQCVYEYVRRIRDRLSGRKYLKPLQAEIVHDQSLVLPSWDSLLDGPGIQKELEEAKDSATSILESLVRRSESERRRLELIFDNLNEAILSCSRDGVVEATNLTTRTLLGAGSTDLIGKQLESLFPAAFEPSSVRIESDRYLNFLDCVPCDQAAVYEDLADKYATYVRVKSTILNRQAHTEYLRKDGTALSIWLNVNVLIEAPFTKDLHYIVVIRDITERRKVDSEVAALRSMNASLQWASTTPVFYKDADLKLTSINKPFRDMLGVSDNLIGQPMSSVFDQVSADRLDTLDRTAMTSPRGKFAHMTLKTLAGVVHEAVVFSRALRTGDEVMSITGAFIDNSELDAQARSEIFALVSKALVFLDRDMRVTGCNDEFVRMVGLDKSQIVGANAYKPELATFIRREMTGVLSDIIEVGTRHINRTCVPVSTSISSQQDGMVYVYFVQFDN